MKPPLLSIRRNQKRNATLNRKITAMKTNEEQKAKELTDCLASRGPRVDWIQTEKNVVELWYKWSREWPDREDHSPSELAMTHSTSVKSSMALLRKSARKFRAANKETAQ